MSSESNLGAVNVLLLGHGNVGSAFARLLQEKRGAFEQRWGLNLRLAGVVRRSNAPIEGLDSRYLFTDIDEALAATSPQIVVELIGGVEHAADMILKSLGHGAHVVTANKAVLAEEGARLYGTARDHDQLLLGEASVAGAVPVLRTLHTSLASDTIERIIGVWNGTCNYILTRMEDEGLGFQEVLEDAQALGYAESDPELDIGGGDTAHKAVVLAQLAYGVFDKVQECDFRGITEFEPRDLSAFAELALRPKLVGLLDRVDKGIVRYIGPALIPLAHPIAALKSVNNGIFLEGRDTGAVFLSGPGAGPGPTATAVLGDVVEIARLHKNADTKGFNSRWGNASSDSESILSPEHSCFPCYVRVKVQDEPGVLAKLAQSFADQSISIRSVDQPVTEIGDDTTLYFTTHPAAITKLQNALSQWQTLGYAQETPFWLPILGQQD